MIIVPTEKRFDWQNAPIVLFFIVILNVLVFYAYQTGDLDHFEEALRVYVSDGIFEQERPLYRDFLVQAGDVEKQSQFEEIEQYPNADYAAAYILQDEAFYDYLISNGPELFKPDYYEYWLYQREYIHDLIFEVSYKKHGLIASDISITSLVAHQFLHAGVMHLIDNMFFLIICGFAVEASLGHKTFLLFYLLSGIGAGLAQVMMDLSSTTPLIGASGAVSGVMAMYLGVFRLKKIEFFYWFFVFVGYFRAPALLILPFYIINELVSLWTMPQSNVGFMAHVGGFVTGAALIGFIIWRKPDTLNTEYIEDDQTAPPIQLSLDRIYQCLDKFQFESALKILDKHMAEFGTDFNLMILKFKLLKTISPKKAQAYFAQIVKASQPNKAQLAKIEKIWHDFPRDERQFDQEAQYKLAWNFVTIPEHIEHAVQFFEDLYQADKKHPTLELLAQKLSIAFKRLENRDMTEKYKSLAQELS